MSNNHEVYIGKLDGAVVYIGEGIHGRHKHLNSGVSNVYSANRIHFAAKSLDVEIYKDGISKQEAIELEKQLIEELNPLWNRTNRMHTVGLTRAYNKLAKEYQFKDNLLHGIVRAAMDLCDQDYCVTISDADFRVYTKGPSSIRQFVHSNSKRDSTMPLRPPIGHVLENFERYSVDGQEWYKFKINKMLLDYPERFLKRSLVIHD